jgi:hypothetical protein
MRLISTTAVAAALPLLVAACSSASPTGTSAPTKPAASSVAADPNAGLLTGTQLKPLLAAASWFPSGFTADPSGSVDTGSAYQQPSSAPGKPDCTKLDTTGWTQLSGVGPVSFAENDYIDRNASEQYAQEIDVYRGTGAQDDMAGLRKLASTCPSFQDSQTSSTVTVKLTAGPALGNDALTVTLDSPRWLGATTLEAVRIGTTVVNVLYSASRGTGATQAVNLETAITTNLKNKG